MNQRLEVLLAEDNPRDREFLLSVLADFSVVAAVNSEDAIRVAGNYIEPHLISDLQMPLMNGIELARRLWQKQPMSRIVFWSQHKDEMYVRALAKIVPPETVYGYVLKDNPTQILLKALHSVFSEGQCWIDPQLRPVQARVRAGRDAISDFEYEVLIDIALGLTDNMIAKRRYLSRRGAQNRLQSLYLKLGVNDDTGAGEAINLRARTVAVALQRGLINAFELEEEEHKLKRWLAMAPLERC